MHLGLKIKVLRMSKGISQQDLADKINKTRALVSHIEQTGKVNSYTLGKICKVFGTDISQLENLVNDSGKQYITGKDQATLFEKEIEILKGEIKFLKELIQTQREIITSLQNPKTKSKNKK